MPIPTLSTVISVVQGIILLGLVVRIIFCAVRLQYETDEAATYKKRIKNSITAAIIVALVGTVKAMLEGYYR